MMPRRRRALLPAYVVLLRWWGWGIVLGLLLLIDGAPKVPAHSAVDWWAQ